MSFEILSLMTTLFVGLLNLNSPCSTVDATRENAMEKKKAKNQLVRTSHVSMCAFAEGKKRVYYKIMVARVCRL